MRRYLIIKDGIKRLEWRTSVDQTADKCLFVNDYEIEHIDDCKIEIIEEMGQEHEVVVLDPVAKAARIENEAILKAQLEADQEAERTLREAIKARAEQYEQNIDDISNLADLKVALKVIVKDLMRIAKRVL